MTQFLVVVIRVIVYLFQLNTAYVMRISDCSSDVCSSDLGVEHSELMLPTDAPEWAADRERLWNAAELAETRKNATVAREYEIALPVELSADERRELALGLAREISERHGVAVDVSIHAPGREGDQRNHH